MKNFSFIVGLVILLGFMVCSLFIGVGNVILFEVWLDFDMCDIFLISCVLWILVLVLVGSVMSVVGFIM